MTKEEQYFISVMLTIKKQLDEKGTKVIGILCADDLGPAYVAFPTDDEMTRFATGILCEAAILILSDGIRKNTVTQTTQPTEVKNIFNPSQN